MAEWISLARSEAEAARALLARSAAIPHPRAFLAKLVVTAEDLSRLVPHANNVEYLRWIDRVAELHADHLEHTRARLLEAGRCFFVARHEVDYLAECWEHEELLVATWVRSMRKTTSWRDTLILRPADGAVICRGSTLWAFVDMSSRRPARIPDAMIDDFDPLERVTATSGATSGATSATNNPAGTQRP
jgi:acyl-CoA thioester hydrolase